MGLLGSLFGGISNMMGNKGGEMGAAKMAQAPDAKAMLSGTGGGMDSLKSQSGMMGAQLPPPQAAMRGPMANGGPSGGFTPGGTGTNMGMQGVGSTLGVKNQEGSIAMPQMKPPTDMQGMMGAGKQGGSGLLSNLMPQQNAMPATPKGSQLGGLLQTPASSQAPGADMKSGALPSNFSDLLSQGMKQSEPGLQKLASSLNPIGTAEGAPSQGHSLGQTSAKYESNKKGVMAMNPEALGQKGVDARGGPSYGAYQLAAGPGTLQTYIKQSPYASEFKGLQPGTTQFNNKWKELAKDPAFAQSQHDFIQKSHYDPVRSFATKAGLADNPGVNDALWSTSVQHGPGGAKSLISAAGIKPGDSPTTQVNKLYAARESRFPKFESRYSAERKDALSLAKNNNTMMASNNPAVTKLQQAGYQPDVERIGRTETAKNPLDAAQRYLGTTEHEGAPTLQGFFKKAGINIDPSKTPWCAAFVDATLKEGGMQGTGNLMAKSYLQWGTETKSPTRGDVVVLSRGDPNGPQGHVGFFAGMKNVNGKDYIQVLGGNQGDSVSVKAYPADRVLGYRKAPTNFADASQMVPAISNPAETSVGSAPSSQPQQQQQSSPTQSFAQNLLSKVFGGEQKGGGGGNKGSSPGGQSSPMSSEMDSGSSLSSPSMPSLGQIVTPRRKMPPVVNKLMRKLGEA